jgi:hypothetical protein
MNQFRWIVTASHRYLHRRFLLPPPTQQPPPVYTPTELYFSSFDFFREGAIESKTHKTQTLCVCSPLPFTRSDKSINFPNPLPPTWNIKIDVKKSVGGGEANTDNIIVETKFYYYFFSTWISCELKIYIFFIFDFFWGFVGLSSSQCFLFVSSEQQRRSAR